MTRSFREHSVEAATGCPTVVSVDEMRTALLVVVISGVAAAVAGAFTVGWRYLQGEDESVGRPTILLGTGVVASSAAYVLLLLA